MFDDGYAFGIRYFYWWVFFTLAFGGFSALAAVNDSPVVAVIYGAAALVYFCLAIFETDKL